MNHQTPNNYREMYTEGNQYFVTYPTVTGTRKDLVQVLETRFSKTGRISAKMQNCATGFEFWTPAKDPATECTHCHIAKCVATKNWQYDGQR